MPIFTVPIHESNDCHAPAGSPAGGQFCSKAGGTSTFDWDAATELSWPPAGGMAAWQKKAGEIRRLSNPWGLPDLSVSRETDEGDGSAVYTVKFGLGSPAGRLTLVHDAQPGGQRDYLVIQTIQVAGDKGKGYGQKLLLAGRDLAHSLGLKGIVSYKTERSADASRAWEGLKRKGHTTRIVKPTKKLLSGYSSSELELFESNDCHTPAGSPAGGQFCSGRGASVVVRPAGWEASNGVADSWKRPGHFYRGMTSAEYEATVGAGRGVQSRQDFSVAGEGTSFSDDPGTAESYVNFGSDDPRVTKRPTYVVEVKSDVPQLDRRDYYFKAKAVIPDDAITRVWKFEADASGNVVAKLVRGAH